MSPMVGKKKKHKKLHWHPSLDNAERIITQTYNRHEFMQWVFVFVKMPRQLPKRTDVFRTKHELREVQLEHSKRFSTIETTILTKERDFFPAANTTMILVPLTS